MTINARYYFGQPVAGGRIAWVAHRQPYYSPYRWMEEDGEDEEGGGYWYGDEEALQGSARLDANGTAEITVPVALDENGNDYSLRIEARVADASSREVSGSTVVNATYGAFLLAANPEQYVIGTGASTVLRIRAVDYLGAPQPGQPVTVTVVTRIPGRTLDGRQRHGSGDDGNVTTDCGGPRRVDVQGSADCWRVSRPRLGAERRPDDPRRHLRVGAGRAGVHERRLRPRSLSRAHSREEDGRARRNRPLPDPGRGVRRGRAGHEGGAGRLLAPGRPCEGQRDDRGAHQRRGHRRHVGQHRVPLEGSPLSCRATREGAGGVASAAGEPHGRAGRVEAAHAGEVSA